MIRRPPRSTRTDTLFPYTTLFRSIRQSVEAEIAHARKISAGELPANAPFEDPVSTNTTFFVGYERSEEHTSELQSLMRISYAVFCLKKKKINKTVYTLQNNIQTLIPLSTQY